MKRLLLWVLLSVGKLSHAHIKAIDLSGCEPAIASYEPADIPLEKYVSHLATANIDSNLKFTKFIKAFPDILQDKPLRRYPELQGQWDILWDMVRKKQLENLSELLTHLKQPEPSDEDRRINGHENTELFADEAPVDAGNWIEDRINEQDEPFNDLLPQEERDRQRHGKSGTYWWASDEDSDAADYDSPEWKKDTIVAILNLNPKMDMQELADKSGVDLSHAISLLEELQTENRIVWITDNSGEYWIVINERNYDRWIYLKISSLLTQNPEMSKREIADKTGRPYSEISEIVKNIRKAIILKLITKNPWITKQKLATTLEIPLKTVFRIIEELETENRLVHKGKRGTRKGYWLVFDKKGRLIGGDPKQRIKETILTLLKENPKMTEQQISNKFDEISIYIVKKAIKELQNEELLIYQGHPPNGGYWAIRNEGGDLTVYDPHQWKEDRVLDQLRENQNLTIPELAKATGISKTTLRRTLTKLQKKDLLRRVGSDKTGRWEVVEKGIKPPEYNFYEERKEKAWLLLKENRQMTGQQLAEELGVSFSTAQAIIKALKTERRLRRIGSTRSGHWKALEKEAESVEPLLL